MNEKLLDLSEKSDSAFVAVLDAVSTVAHDLGIPFFVVGAIARDLIWQFYGIPLRRATLDLDLAVRVRSWDDYQKLIQRLKSEFGFRQERSIHRFSFKDAPIDIVPFGTLADEKGEIHWPKDQGVMSIVGFDDAYQASVIVRLSTNPALEARVSSLSGLAILKLIAWDELYPGRAKDAKDLFLIMNEYDLAGNTDRLFDEEFDLLIEEDHDHTLAGIRLLGRDMAGIADENTLRTIHGILTDEQKQEKLASQMGASDLDHAMMKIKKLLQGLE